MSKGIPYEKVKTAAALKIPDNNGNAPILIAKGKGPDAEQICKLAEENGIPIQQDPTLVGLLGQLDINEAIPDELFEAVAEIFAFIYRLDQNMNES